MFVADATADPVHGGFRSYRKQTRMFCDSGHVALLPVDNSHVDGGGGLPDVPSLHSGPGHLHPEVHVEVFSCSVGHSRDRCDIYSGWYYGGGSGWPRLWERRLVSNPSRFRTICHVEYKYWLADIVL